MHRACVSCVVLIVCSVWPMQRVAGPYGAGLGLLLNVFQRPAIRVSSLVSSPPPLSSSIPYGSALAITTPLSFPQRSVVLSPPILNPTIKHALPATIKAFNGVGLAFFWTGWWFGGGGYHSSCIVWQLCHVGPSTLRGPVLPNGRRKWF